MELIKVRDAHLTELMRWFPNAHSCAVWAGPDFRFPFTATTFRDDIRLDLPSYSLLGADNELLAFGQYYSRNGRCHLARLAVAPTARGRGLGRELIHRLSRIGRRDLKVYECSLFVLHDNAPARRLYERLGFAPATCTDNDIRLYGMVYMVATGPVVDAWEQ